MQVFPITVFVFLDDVLHTNVQNSSHENRCPDYIIFFKFII